MTLELGSVNTDAIENDGGLSIGSSVDVEVSVEAEVDAPLGPGVKASAAVSGGASINAAWDITSVNSNEKSSTSTTELSQATTI